MPTKRLHPTAPAIGAFEQPASIDYALLDKVIDILKSADSPTIYSLYCTVELLHERLLPAAAD
jgi:hypothetical protein